MFRRISPLVTPKLVGKFKLITPILINGRRHSGPVVPDRLSVGTISSIIYSLIKPNQHKGRKKNVVAVYDESKRIGKFIRGIQRIGVPIEGLGVADAR